MTVPLITIVPQIHAGILLLIRFFLSGNNYHLQCMGTEIPFQLKMSKSGINKNNSSSFMVNQLSADDLLIVHIECMQDR